MNNLILIGPMGAGKSTIGRLLSRLLHMPLRDSDREIELRTGTNIPWIFDVEGEAGFREREQAVIADLCHQQGVVLSTGGGAVLRPANREVLRASGWVIYLHASVDQQVERISRDRNRPLLRKGDPAAILGELMLIRDPLYREIAHMVVPTDQRPPKMVVQEILERLKKLHS